MRSGSAARRVIVNVLIGLAAVLGVVAMVSVWADRQLLDPGNWSATSTRLLQDRAVRDATATYAVDQLYANVDVPGLLHSGLPGPLRALAGPVAGALRTAAVRGATLALSDPRVQSLWAVANRAAARALVVIVEGGAGRVKIEGGVVTLDLAAVVREIAARIGLPARLASSLPASLARVRVLKSDQLALVQDIGRAVRGLALWLTVVVPVLYALALGLAAGRRRRTLMTIGLAILLTGVLVLLGRQILGSRIPASLVADASLRPAATAVVSLATSMLGEIAAEFVLVGAAAIIAGWLGGPASAARGMRRGLAPWLRDHPGPAYAITVLAMALVFIWEPIRALGTPVGAIVALALALLATTVLRRETIGQFPDAAAGDATRAIRAGIGRLRSVGG